MISIDFSDIQLKLLQLEGKMNVFDPVRKKWIILTPEEHVRQYILQHMISTMQYPSSLIAVEKTIQVGEMSKRFDIVVYSREHKPWMLVECKEPQVAISQKTLHQLLNYQRTMQSNYWLLTNGHQTFCANASDITNINWMDSLPAYDR